ncbi:hypothetical protein DPR02_18060 [Burkholderia cepacia]|uniref:Uncharacterized protein n=1 Tax=Burkholderia cepacia TaxID=292 RepID=A0AAQ0FG08_BURCE|nr:hypothetical protein DPR02_18060 [Burkholderia cepacia]
MTRSLFALWKVRPATPRFRGCFGVVPCFPVIRDRSPERLVLEGTTRSGYIEIQNIACDLIEYA